MDDKNSVKETIISKALELFAVQGYEGVSVNEICEAAGITKPTLYYYFGNKEGVFNAVIRDHYERLNAIISKNAVYYPNVRHYHKDINPTLANAANAYFSFARENESFYRIVLANLSMPQSSPAFNIVKEYHTVQFDIIEAMFRNMAKYHGNLRGKHKILGWSFIGTINSYISLYFGGILRQGLNENSVRELVHQFMHGIFA